MDAASWFFWCCVLVVAYTCVGYPLLLAARASWRPRPVRRAPFQGSITIILAARNEARSIGRRVAELCDHLEATGLEGELIVVSDGSTDATVALAQEHGCGRPVRVIEVAENVGKAAALSQAAALARGEVLVFADARQRWEAGALSQMLENFADPEVGGVSGDLVLESAPGMLAGVGLYWRFEKWLRKKETQYHSLVGVTGAICAVRRCLFQPIPAGILLDDVYWSLLVARQGYRVVHDERARAFDRLPAEPAAEMRRKVRTLAGNYQLAARLPGTLLPWRNPVWWTWISHKLLRLVVPWALLAALIASAWLAGPLYRSLFLLQLWAYAIALIGLTRFGKRSRLLAAAGSFLVLNTAAWLSFWVWLSGRAGQSWRPIRYHEEVDAAPLTPKVPAESGAMP